MKMNEEQLLDLYAFTRRHFVEYYDLQTELVDHLANDIELIRTEIPSLSFEEARNVAFKKFGVFGFAEIVEQRQNAMSKRYWKYIWNELKQWITLPKIMLTSALWIMFYILFSSNISHYFFCDLLCLFNWMGNS